MKHCRKFLWLLPLLALVGCSNPADQVPAAAVRKTKPVELAKAQKLPAGAKAYTLSTNSMIGFIGSKVTGSHAGGFNKFAGQFLVVDGKLAGDLQQIVIDMTSAWSDSERLTGHLKSPDFFDVAQFPTATFASTAIEPGAAGHTVIGNLTLHGVTQSISFPADIQTSDKEVAVKADFSINRFDFGIKYPGKTDDLIRKEVVLKLNVRATPGTADFAALEQAAKSAAASAAAAPQRRGRKQKQ